MELFEDFIQKKITLNEEMLLQIRKAAKPKAEYSVIITYTSRLVLELANRYESRRCLSASLGIKHARRQKMSDFGHGHPYHRGREGLGVN